MAQRLSEKTSKAQEITPRVDIRLQDIKKISCMAKETTVRKQRRPEE